MVQETPFKKRTNAVYRKKLEIILDKGEGTNKKAVVFSVVNLNKIRYIEKKIFFLLTIPMNLNGRMLNALEVMLILYMSVNSHKRATLSQ